MSRRFAGIPLTVCAALLAANTAHAADLSCNGLIAPGQKMICSGFEPNWAVELICSGNEMTSNFIDAFSGDGITTTPGSVTFLSENPWTISTGTGVEGTIAYTPGGCRDESDAVRDFTFSPRAAPGLSGPFFPFCCRIE